jgi:hypothetical protein
VDVAARLAWTSAAYRRAAGKPGAVGIRAPPPGTVTGDPPAAPTPGACMPESGGPAFGEIAGAAGGIMRTHGPCQAPGSACACPAEARGGGIQAGSRARRQPFRFIIT